MHALLSGPVVLLLIIAQAVFFLYLLRGLIISSRDDDWLGTIERPNRRANGFDRPPRPEASERGSRGWSRLSDNLETYHDPASGAMSGRVIAGPYLGRRLEDLSRADLMRLIEYCRARQDDYASSFIETYMRRRFAGAGASSGGGRERQREKAPGPQDGEMTRERAYHVLGLEVGASDADIQKAHRALIKKYHPDHGGSHALAATINQAKDFLIVRAH